MKRLLVLLAVFLLASCAHNMRSSGSSSYGGYGGSATYGMGSAGTMGSGANSGWGAAIVPDGTYGLSGP